MTRLLFLYLEIARSAMYPRQYRYWHKVQQYRLYMQDANLKSGTPIFKIRLLEQFVSYEILK